MSMMQSDVYLLIFFSHVRFRLTEVAKLDSQEVDDFLKANGLDYKPVCTINITHLFFSWLVSRQNSLNPAI